MDILILLMLAAKTKLNKIVLLRPGALGDVLAVRGVIRFLKDAFPGIEICLVAPGERGMFFQRDGWADRIFDWDRTAFSWLFSDGGQAPPPALQAVFSEADLILSYMGGDTTAVLEDRLKELVPTAGAVFCPSAPLPGHEEGIGQWLVRAAWTFCSRYNFLPPAYLQTGNFDRLAATKLRITDGIDVAGGMSGYAVMHPGSGSKRKNWPLENYIELGRRLQAKAEQEADLGLSGLVITSGEADADLGSRLADALPGAEHVHQPALELLSGILANARLYVGNDSGVTHLAASVENRKGVSPRVIALFGPTDATVWAPPGALILQDGCDMTSLSVDIVWDAINDLDSEIRSSRGECDCHDPKC